MLAYSKDTEPDIFEVVSLHTTQTDKISLLGCSFMTQDYNVKVDVSKGLLDFEDLLNLCF